jgi:AmiR/NasT family two-component response regulator
MAIQILRDLRGLRVQVIHAPDSEGESLVEHLRRIGCTVEVQWPIPECFAEGADVVLLSVDHEYRDDIQKLVRNNHRRECQPTLIAIVAYENPSILQLVLESGALAVVERPIRLFGLLTHLTIARSLWLERRDAERRVRKLERKLSGVQKIQKAKSILMERKGLTEEDAYQAIRRQAMGKRVSMEDMAATIISANELLHS